jgi:DNA-binding IclR family transcriptional regulator
MPKKSAHPSLAEINPAAGGAVAVDRALSLLTCFQAGDASLSLSELSTRAILHKSTTLRLLASLQHARLIQRMADDRYAIGVEAARLQSIYMAAFNLGDMVYPVLHALVKCTGESAAYSVIQASHRDDIAPQRLCVYRVSSPHVIRDHFYEGELLPLSRGAAGRVLMAYATAPELRSITVTEEDAKQLAQVRRDGYFAAVGDRSPDLAGIAAPVFNSNGSLAASLTLTLPSSRYKTDFIKPVVQLAAALVIPAKESKRLVISS